MFLCMCVVLSFISFSVSLCRRLSFISPSSIQWLCYYPGHFPVYTPNLTELNQMMAEPPPSQHTTEDRTFSLHDCLFAGAALCWWRRWCRGNRWPTSKYRHFWCRTGDICECVRVSQLLVMNQKEERMRENANRLAIIWRQVTSQCPSSHTQNVCVIHIAHISTIRIGLTI